jgi:hypothetical protein
VCAERVLATDVVRLANHRLLYGSLLSERGRPAEAIPLLEQALAVREEGLGPNSPVTRMTAGELAKALARAGRTAEAEALRTRLDLSR